MKSNNPSQSRRSSAPGMKSLALGRAFFNKSKLGGVELMRNPHPGDILRLDGFGGDILLNDGQQVTLQLLINISVSGVIVFTTPKAQTPGHNKQAASFKDAHQSLVSKGFGVYGLVNDPPTGINGFDERRALSFKLICDESRSLTRGLGLDIDSRGIVAIGKDGRVLASAVSGPQATLEGVAPLIHTLDMLERTPTREYAGSEYFTRSPTSPLTPASAADEQGSYFGNLGPVSPSMASLHSYLQSMDSVPSSPSRSTVQLQRLNSTSRSHTVHVPGIHDQLSDEVEACQLCGASQDLSGGCKCDPLGDVAKQRA